MTARGLFALLFVIALSGPISAWAAIGPVVKVTGGEVRGTDGKTAGFAVFKGIPYAAPPVGDLRWRPTARPASWAGVRPADHFAPDCYSLGSIAESTAGGMSEDCLYLNVWTPAHAPSERLPVMVWIYGGAFVSGSPSYPRYDGDGLNRKGVILVTFNFRTGVLGFFSHPGLTAESPGRSSGNYGLLDSIAALKWVRDNIARFGGDPNRVTLFGQSSGSQTVNLLVASPLARGLFQRAIGESGAGFGEREPKTKAQAEAGGRAYATRMGADLQQLRAKSAVDILAGAKRGDFEPIVDSWVLPGDPHKVFSEGRQNDVPTLLGSTADESQLSRTLTLEGYRAEERAFYGSHADTILEHFPASTDDEARVANKAFKTMVLGDFNVGEWAALQARTGRSAIYQYRFTHAPPPYKGPGSPPGPPSVGAPHGAEIIYAFNNLDTQPRTWTDTDRRVADIVSSYWTNFAKTGDPNGPGLPPWPNLRRKPDAILEIGDQVHPIAKPNLPLIDLMDHVFYGPDGLYADSVTHPR